MPVKKASAFVELPIKTAVERKKISQEDRQAHCDTWRRSGLSMSEYCRRYQLSVSSLSQWVTRLNQKTFTSASLPPSLRRAPTAFLEKQSLEIILTSGIRLKFPEIIDSLPLVKLIKLLDDACK